MISDNLGIYSSYKRLRNIDEINKPVNSMPQGRTFSPEDQERYNKLREQLKIKQEQKQDGETK
mgnify:FL=1|jgi:hypothetical protein